MNILITGGAGFIGHHTANTLARGGYKVRVLDNLCPQVHTDRKESIRRLHSSVEFVSGDVRSHSDLRLALKGIDTVYHIAAETGVGQSMYEMDRYVDVNVRGTAVLCECLADIPRRITRLVLASSRAVYGEGRYWCDRCGNVFPAMSRPMEDLASGKWDFDCPQCGCTLTPRPTDEGAPLRPISVYGITKQAQEELCGAFSRAFHVSTVILRYFNVFGPGQCLSNPYTGIASIFCTQMFANEPVEVYEDGAMLRDFVHIRDVVQANAKALLMDNPGVVTINIASGYPLSLLRFAELLKAEIGSRSIIEISGRFRIGDIRHSLANMTHASELIGYRPQVSIAEGLGDLVEWARDRPESSALGRSLKELSARGLTGVAGEAAHGE